MVLNEILEFQTMLFGPCNFAAIIQRLMQTVLIRLLSKHCVIYFDDTHVFGRNIWEHNTSFKLVLDGLQDVAPTLNKKKCHFHGQLDTVLWHTVSSEWMVAMEDRANYVRTPTNQTELCIFSVWRKYCGRLDKGFAKIASLQHRLTKKHARKNFRWESKHDEFFIKRKQTLCPAPNPALPNFENNAPPLELDTDASNTTVYGVLSQREM